IRATISPGLMSISIPRKAGMPAYSTWRFSMRRIAGLMLFFALGGSSILPLRPEIGFDHTRMIAYVGRATAGQFLSVVEDGDAVAGSHHQLHVVLHPHTR